MLEKPISEFITLYEEGLLSEVIVVKDKIYAKMVPNQDEQGGIIWSAIP